ncbi:Uma2 family endonuclease [Pannus brasiliensis CCIBt3594]|uniref:Uma2 family endonuclease n=1 Tax=Pannus brasiliensis CCIBt3594 TaxID=1427578 RepID=A0AAW9QZ74_9CHRO
MLETTTKKLTLEEFLLLPETEPASEYIDGEVSQKEMPQGKHSRVQGKLVTAINAIAELARSALAFPELRCTFGGRSIVPDVVVLEWNKIPVDATGEIQNVIVTPPDWIVEILSPDQDQTKVIKKILHCLNHGTRLGWMIDPKSKTILAFPAGQQPRAFEEAGEVLPVLESIEGLELSIETIFGWLKI